MYFVPGANLPYRLIVECTEGETIVRTIVGSEISYDQEKDELSILLTDNNTGNTERLSGVRLNSELFRFKYYNEIDNYFVTMAACFLYALDCNIAYESEVANLGLAEVLSGLFSTAVIDSFVVSALLVPELVVTGVAIAMKDIAANTVWPVVPVASSVTAVGLGVTENVLNQNGAYGTDSSEPEIEPPHMLIYKVDSEENPTETPNAEECFENDGIICLHYNDEDKTEQVFCVEFIGNARPLSIEIGQSEYCKDLHIITISEDFDSNSQSSLNYIPDKFYFSIAKNSDYYPNGIFSRIFMFMRITPNKEGFVSYINGKEAKLTTEFYEMGLINKPDAQKIMSFCSTSGPMFIIGTVGVGFFANEFLGIMLICPFVSIIAIYTSEMLVFFSLNSSESSFKLILDFFSASSSILPLNITVVGFP